MDALVKMRTVGLVLIALLATPLSVTTSRAASAPEIEAGVNATLDRFFHTIGSSRELASRATGILVFPTIVKAGIGIGGEYGEGALRIRGRTVAYFNSVSASIGFQLGAQARSVIIMFMTGEALAGFQATNGWKIGVDGSVTVIVVGAGGAIDTNTIRAPIVGFIIDQKGLMYNLTLEGSKITRIYR